MTCSTCHHSVILEIIALEVILSSSILQLVEEVTRAIRNISQLLLLDARNAQLIVLIAVIVRLPRCALLGLLAL